MERLGQNQSRVTRHSLLARMKDISDDDSWQEFFDAYWEMIFQLGRKAGLREDEAQDLVQDTFLDLTKNISRFRCDPRAGSFRGYLAKLTKWRIIDRLRKRRSEEIGCLPGETSRQTDLVDRFADVLSPSLDDEWDRQWREQIVDVALRRIRRRVDPAHLQLYDLFVLKGWKSERIVRLLGVSRSQIYHAKERIGRLVEEEVQRLGQTGF